MTGPQTTTKRSADAGHHPIPPHTTPPTTASMLCGPASSTWLGSEVMFFSSLLAATSFHHPGPRRTPPRHTGPSGSHDPLSPAWEGPSSTRSSARAPSCRIWLPAAGDPLRGQPVLRMDRPQAADPTHTAFGSLLHVGAAPPHVAAVSLPPGPSTATGRGPGRSSVFQGVSYYWHFVEHSGSACTTSAQVMSETPRRSVRGGRRPPPRGPRVAVHVLVRRRVSHRPSPYIHGRRPRSPRLPAAQPQTIQQTPAAVSSVPSGSPHRRANSPANLGA